MIFCSVRLIKRDDGVLKGVGKMWWDVRKWAQSKERGYLPYRSRGMKTL